MVINKLRNELSHPNILLQERYNKTFIDESCVEGSRKRRSDGRRVRDAGWNVFALAYMLQSFAFLMGEEGR